MIYVEESIGRLLRPVVYHHEVSQGCYSKFYEWQQDSIPPFDNLILSWNARQRPHTGYYLFSVRVKMDEKWSDWIAYMQWGSDTQRSFSFHSQEGHLKVDQDITEIVNGQKAHGFAVKIAALEGAVLDEVIALHVCISNSSYLCSSAVQEVEDVNLSIQLDLKGISQRALQHERSMSLCSPVSTTAVLNYLSPKCNVDPLSFASQVWDAGFDIFGNWVLNVAEAFTKLENGWRCWVARLSGFQDIVDLLKKQIPVIVSVRGPLLGSPFPYASGHLIVVRGFSPIAQRVLCMDPAFPVDTQTLVHYALSDFIQAWQRRGYVAYIFEKVA